MNIEIYNFFVYFIIYAFIGWILESIFDNEGFALIKKDCGFFYGPIRPIYGFGAMLIILVFSNFSDNIYLIFFGSVFLISFLEYFVGAIIEKYFNKKLWSYEDKKINFKGRICLEYSLIWGLLSIFLIKFFHPCLEYLVKFPNTKIVYTFILIFFVYFVFDSYFVFKKGKML
ncbi:MAG: putative ABC transporter permease [Candidatus Gracilibacteria bacterium]|nr:putative ABC transporter permease [Candidatus Gracilibacteria bacterium]MDD3120583.1 putative ABC transporter permease [Candidatus Gracilibacteria bacterium]MDD4530755.1 putative ABC transporter permease [Candidatus Gracilibacteria bacterium]